MPSGVTCFLIFSVVFVEGVDRFRDNREPSCGTSMHRFRRDDLAVRPIYADSIFTSHKEASAYFSGHEIIQFKKTKIFNKQFTVELWIKPEGGQNSDVPIINYYDQCVDQKNSKLWSLGVREAENGRDSRFYFSLKTHRIKEPHITMAHLSYPPNIWVHIAVVFNGSSLKFFINQAQVAVSHKQLSPVSVTPYSKCEVLEVGGDSRLSRFFRGTIDDLRVWNIAKSQRRIIRDMIDGTFESKYNELVLNEDFETLYSNGKSDASYAPVTISGPKLVSSTVPKDSHHIEISKPLCGITVCDNPEVVKGYKNNIDLRKKKLLRYRMINIVDDDGGNPLVTKAQIEIQHNEVNKAFSRYNITWKKSDYEVRNTSLRNRVVLFSCERGMIGNNICEQKCNHPITGYDGGDCETVNANCLDCMKCDKSKKRNGICNPECNRFHYEWDGGDCCDEGFTDTSRTCLDPRSPNRAYVTIAELKHLVNLTNEHFLNIFVVEWNQDVFGKATFPWDKFALGNFGGVVLSAKRFGKTDGVNDMIHELGHVLGLWHVFRGVSELYCDDECFETHASMELGDLCADTNPTPRNTKCGDPDKGVCGIEKFNDTPYRNYMNYATGSCPNNFSGDQVARMHCYIDLMYQTWSMDDQPSVIPIIPKALSYNDGNLQIEWLPPIGMGREFARRHCDACTLQSNKLNQFAVSAYSPLESDPSGIWAPVQAIGPPDAKTCSSLHNVWSPEQDKVKKCTPEICYIELGFQHAVVPVSIKVWVTNNLKNTLENIQLLHTDGSVTSLGHADTQCDVPYTREIFTDRAVNKIRIRVGSKDIGIDAVQITSKDSHQTCMECPEVKYTIQRKPPFRSGAVKQATGTRYKDNEIENGISYEYRIQTTVGDFTSPFSMPLKFSSQFGFCGDGIIERENEEECDDGNSRDGDGCNIWCKREDIFKCKGQPSICYKYEGDGVCEEFEKQISIVDCGFYVPSGFEQQWATGAEANPKYQCNSNSINVIAGPPPLDLKCVHSEPIVKKSWRPCDEYSYVQEFWVEATFKKPAVASAVILYIASDRRAGMSPRKKNYVKVELIDTENQRHSVGTEKIAIDCKRHPVTIPVYHDMTTAYFRTSRVRISFPAYGLAISAVSLLSSTRVNPAVASDCNMNAMEYYNPRTHSCYSYKCNRPVCKPLAVKNAEIVCTGNNDGDWCKVKCLEGYLPIKPTITKCILGKWSDPVKVCQPIDCGKLKIKGAKVECKDGTTLKNTCVFYCIGSARLHGKDNRVTCMKDGLWSARKASCQMYCSAPNQVENSVPLDVACDANHMKARRKNDMGSTCRFKCLPGYVITSKPSTAVGRHIKLTCNEDGRWAQDATCEKVKCPELSIFNKKVYNCTDGNSYDSLCFTVCPRDKVIHEVRCQKDGTWSTTFNYCEYTGACEKLLDTGDLSFISCSNEVGSLCVPKCRMKDHDVVIKTKEELLNIKLLCSPEQRWFPDPRNLYCVPSCEDQYKEDGYCDCSNNNKHCNYDNGDCCAATVKGGKVEFLDLKNTCKCLDPRVR